jgi:hypothetical protein
MDVTKNEPKTYTAALRETLDRASRGDTSVMPALTAAFDAHPELVEAFGDLGKHAETALLDLTSKSCLTAREAITRQLRDLRDRLNVATGSELERLLVARLSLDWLSLQHATIDLAGQLELSGTSLAATAAQKRLDRCHGRFLASGKALANVSRLLRRGPSPLDLLRVQGDAQAPSRATGHSARRFVMPAAVN